MKKDHHVATFVNKKVLESDGDDATPIVLEEGTNRRLEARHIQMIALGGTIGTGLFLNSSNVISSAGAIGALLAYVIAGTAIFFVVSSLGEMATLIPVSGSFSTYASRFLDPALGLTIGWNYCLLWFIVLPIELMSTASFLTYWVNIDQYVLMLGILVVLVGINLVAVKGFGEIEYWLALIKILAIVFFIFVSIYVLIRENPGLSNYDAAGGPFLGAGPSEAFKNTMRSMVGACFAFGGTEMVGITAGEAKNPRKSVPTAINGTFWRIIVFYVSSILLIGLLLPANLPEFKSGDDLVKSPYVIALQYAGIPGVNHFMNFICFVAVLSAANSAIYASSRSLMALAVEGHAPKILSKTSNSGVPIYAVGVTVCFASVAFLGKIVGDGVVFQWLIKLMGLSIIVIWMFINLTHLRFRKAYITQGFLVKDLPYRAVLFPYGAYFGIVMCLCIIVLNPLFACWDAMQSDGEKSPVFEFFSNIITIPFFVVVYLVGKFTRKTKIVSLKDMDLVTGNINLGKNSYEEDTDSKRPKGRFARFVSYLA